MVGYSKSYIGYVVKDDLDAGETLEQFTAVMSYDKDREPSSVSISSTYHTKSKLSLAVIYNCNRKQKEKIERILRGSPEASTHPLLLPGVFAELQRDRLQKLVDNNFQASFDLQNSLKLISRAYSDNSDDERISRKVNEKFRKGIVSASLFEEEVRATKQHLERMIKFIHSQSSALNAAEFQLCTARYQVRFDEILMEIDTLLAHCRIISADLTYACEFLTRQETARAGRQAKISTVIAFVAMLYLPMTSVATIFAMPIFGFQNKWLDIYFNLAKKKSDSELGSDHLSNDGPASSLPVLSGYFWIYLAISTTLTGATVGFYIWYTREQTSIKESDDLVLEHQIVGRSADP
ncbi:hypothetical protein QBC43DRAFT_222337 [Cladorrhinum sp. PSN259]|nr:hypothetical protein QBC43DRAFT_222337 [Cladorrhinum sp. PSN259]